MIGLTLSLTIGLATAPAGGQTYAQAHAEAIRTGAPIVVLVGADWCPACRQMKTSTIPALKRAGGLDQVAFAVVNVDRERDLADKLMTGGSIPQLVIYTQTKAGWQRRQLTGAQSVETVQSLIELGLAETAVADSSAGSSSSATAGR